MGDSILDSLSLPPSGRAASKEPTGAEAAPSDDTQRQTETPIITSVIGIMSNEDVPVMVSANKRVLRDGGGDKVDAGKTGEKQPEKREVAKPGGGIKRKQPNQSESDEEAERKVRFEVEGTGSTLSSSASVLKAERESEEDPNVLRTGGSKREDVDVKPLHDGLSPYFVSCQNKQQRVLPDKLPSSAHSISKSSGASKSPCAQWLSRRRKPSGKPDSAFPASDNKE